MNNRAGYSLVILMMAAFVLAVGLLVAIPVWQTQVQREKEEELIFRGRQYVEAVRLYMAKNPATIPKSLDELVKGRFLRRLYKDPMTKDGKWNLILQYQVGSQNIAFRSGPGRPPGNVRAGLNVKRILIVPQDNLSAVDNPRILGVVSSSPKKSFRIYNDGETYDQWLFYYGADPNAKPEIVYFGRTEKK
jgi:type II secretory pathway pseudopilin PulG